MAKSKSTSTKLIGLLDQLNKIEQQHEDASSKLDTILRKRGWKYTSNTPGSIWLWEKKLPDGRTALVNVGTAIDFEKDLCGEIPW